MDSAIPGYVRRLLLEGGRAGRALFRRLFAIGQDAVGKRIKDGFAAPGADPRIRAAFLMANDLAVLLLRDHLTETIGIDPLSAPGMKRWAGEVLAIYSSGLGAANALQKTSKPRPVKSRQRINRGGNQR